MKLPEISHIRLQNQQLTQPRFQSPKNLLRWMGAIQAQDYEMAKWALGIRLPGSTRKEVEKAIDKGSIIRTHLLRPTWHFAAAEDVRWMMDLTAPRIRVGTGSRHKYLGLTKEIISRSNKIIEKALSDQPKMKRQALVEVLEKAGFKNEDNLASHLLLSAELDKVICSGPSIGSDYTYTLFEEQVPHCDAHTKDEALVKLAKAYFNSHGPATLEDFNWWSGLTKTGAQKALDFIKSDLTSEKIDSKTYWFPDRPRNSVSNEEPVHLLPAYDEFLISYKDRSPSIRIKDQEKAISINGIFRPIIVANSEVIGTWKRSEKEKDVYVETRFFTNPSKKIILQVEEAADKFAVFLDKSLMINHVVP